jgi:hypothetical protein
VSKKKKILISAGGTASALHLVRVLKANYAGVVEGHVCDINPAHLVAASLEADGYVRVPAVTEDGYRQAVLDYISRQGIGVYVPLIDMDLEAFPGDDPDLAVAGCASTAPTREVTGLITDKRRCFAWLAESGLPVPRVYTEDEISESGRYFVKPLRGFGSRGARVASGEELVRMRTQSVPGSGLDDLVVQEICSGPEVTVEVFHHGGVTRTLCRERIEVKAGVCTKARVFFDDELDALVCRMVGAVSSWPVASCVQFMKNADGAWVVTDVNLRIGAGSALCSAAGWDLSRAALASWLGLDDDPARFLVFDPGRECHVVRSYQEHVMQWS